MERLLKEVSTHDNRANDAVIASSQQRILKAPAYALLFCPADTPLVQERLEKDLAKEKEKSARLDQRCERAMKEIEDLTAQLRQAEAAVAATSSVSSASSIAARSSDALSAAAVTALPVGFSVVRLV